MQIEELPMKSVPLVTCELIWLKELLKELQFAETMPMMVICDNKAALHIASNHVFHETTKYIEIDCHFIR